MPAGRSTVWDARKALRQQALNRNGETSHQRQAIHTNFNSILANGRRIEALVTDFFSGKRAGFRKGGFL
jgi:hypothetical protein